MPIAVYIAVALNVLFAQTVSRVTGFETYHLDLTDAYVVGSVMALRPILARYPLFKLVMVPVETAMLLLYASISSCTLSYAVQTFNYPYQDAAFQAFDRALGFDHVAFMTMVQSNASLYALLRRGYEQFYNVPLALVALSMVFYRSRNLAPRFITAFIFSTMLTCLISAFMPAQGAVILLDAAAAKIASGASPLDHLEALRAGTMHKMPQAIGGIISFPSMHVGLGLLILYFTRGTRMVWAFAPFALTFIFTSMTHGAHYLADGFAAFPMIALAIFLSENLHRLTQPVPALKLQTA